LDTTQKRIVLGVTGSIAAYKAGDIIRELRRKQMDIKVVMTPEASRFISETTLASLSRNPVATDIFSPQTYGMVPHIDLAQGMDLFLVAPATANCLARFAHGMADDLLSALFLAARSPTLMAPAMNPAMYAHPMVQANIKILKKNGVFFIDPIYAEVACGQKGQGHLASVEDICTKVEEILFPLQPFKDKTFLITAGPTREFIDSVRYLSNPSSGRMGFALAKAAQKKGAHVILVSGPTALLPPERVRFIPVTTAEEMKTEVERYFPDADMIIMSAAVTDFKPVKRIESKIKKEKGLSNIQLEPTPDILSRLGKKKLERQILVGFAAEDRDMIQNAKKKLEQKGLDLIVANDISQSGIGFESDTNQVTLITSSGEIKSLPKEKKERIAERILEHLENLLKTNNP
jgi:phosphopantothenoylcysteine decarboxylase/phosphopantothenate--cysteine ligase